jgi:hypothetical protein
MIGLMFFPELDTLLLEKFVPMKLHEKGKTSNSEWFGVEHYRIFHEMDLFRYVNMERLQMLYPDIFRNPKPKSIIPSHPS